MNCLTPRSKCLLESQTPRYRDRDEEEDKCKILIDPFLFIRGLSCPCCIQASLSLNCLKLTIPGFPYNCLPVSCGDIGYLKKNPRPSVGQEIRPQSAFSAFRPLLPSANYSAEWSGRVVWSHPTEKVWIQTKRALNCNYYLLRLSQPTGWATLPSDNISGSFF